MTGKHANSRGRVWRLGLAVALFAASAMYVIAARFQTAYGCTPGEPGCVYVSASAPGNPGRGASGQPGGGGSPSPPDPCAKYPGQYYTMCKTNTGVQCLVLYDQFYGTMPLAQFNALAAANSCPRVARAAPPSPAKLAQRAAASFQLPLPSGHRSPSESLRYKGVPYTWVNLWTYFWTDAAMWRLLSATARAGGVWAQVVARPVSLTFDPGDGSPAVSCAGPGHPWVNADGNDAPADGCGFRYRDVTDGTVTSTQTITWQLTWTGSGNTSGTLAQRTTSTSGQLRVMQIQVVTTR
jgi:hypothetical protein